MNFVWHPAKESIWDSVLCPVSTLVDASVSVFIWDSTFGSVRRPVNQFIRHSVSLSVYNIVNEYCQNE